MKRYERKINHKPEDLIFSNFRCPEKISLQKIQEYANEDNLNFTESELKDIQTITYTLCEIIYTTWVRTRKQKITIENDIKSNEESQTI